MRRNIVLAYPWHHSEVVQGKETPAFWKSAMTSCTSAWLGQGTLRSIKLSPVRLWGWCVVEMTPPVRQLRVRENSRAWGPLLHRGRPAEQDQGVPEREEAAPVDSSCRSAPAWPSCDLPWGHQTCLGPPSLANNSLNNLYI